MLLIRTAHTKKTKKITMYELYCHTVYKGTFYTYDAAVAAAMEMGVFTYDIMKV